MKPNLKKSLVGLCLIVLILGSFGLGFFLGKNQIICQSCPPSQIDLSLFWDAWNKIQDNFTDKTKINTQDMIYGAISGMVKSLNDPYTVFFKPDETKLFSADVNGSFEGVGMEIDIRNNQLQVIAPLEGSPAQKAGIKPGDKILKINDQVTTDMSLEQAINLIRGPKGTEVTLTISRDEWTDPKDIKVTRDVINVPALKWELKDNNIAYIALYEFSQNAGNDFSKAAIEILNSPADRIIIDLRNNPGGYLEVSQEIAGWFLERGQVVVVEDFGEGKEKKTSKAEGNAHFSSYPVVVLINGSSASASEILAGALRDDRSIQLVGEKSFGKGSVQELEKFTDGSSLKITVAKWLTPKGESISEKGLEPDIKVDLTDADAKAGKDPQLDKAIEIIKNLK